MKWVTTDYKGNPKVWYSEDVINRIREEFEELFNQYVNNKDKQLEPFLQGGVIVSRKVLDILNEVEK